MFNRRTYQPRARRAKLQGEQIDIGFPRRGRTSRVRRLERAGQMRLGLTTIHATEPQQTVASSPVTDEKGEDIRAAVDYLFPVGPMTEDELFAEFNRLFPLP